MKKVAQRMKNLKKKGRIMNEKLKFKGCKMDEKSRK